MIKSVRSWALALSLAGGFLATPVVVAAATVTVPGNYSRIQDAINAVLSGALPDGSTIEVQPGTYPEALAVANTGRSLTVRGVGGAGTTIVDAVGQGAAALYISQATGQIVFEGLTFRRGTPPGSPSGGGFLIRYSSPSIVNSIFELSSAFNGGGGAIIAASPTFTGCTIRNNSATHFGGGVFIYLGSQPTFTNCSITGNASGTTTSDGAGGGVGVFDASPTFRSSHINGNTSKFAGGGIFLQGYYNEQVQPNNGRAMLLLEDTEVADNISTNPSEGGGIHAEDNATATLTRTRILRNRAGTGGGLNAYRARYDIVDSVIDGNRTTASSGFGGGIATQSNYATASIPASIINLTRTLVRNNEALMPGGVGGGIVMQGDNFSGLKETLTLADSVVDGNRSTIQGGGIHVSRATLTVSNSLLIRNTTGDIGGGILVLVGATATVSGTTIAHNSAGQFGGGIYIGGTTINVSATNIYENTANTRGGGVFVPDASRSGTIQTSIIADNGPSQVSEESCSSVQYPNNTITTKSGTSMWGIGCGSSIASRAPGVNSNAPRFAHFLAVPASGTSFTLAWSVARATSVTVTAVGTFNSPTNSPTGSADVAPSSSTTYSLTATATGPNGGPYSVPVNASVTVVAPPVTPPTGGAVDSDFDGDGRADVGVFRPSSGVWYLRGLSTTTWGGGGDIPVTGDYDGDRRADVAVFRPSTGAWFILLSSTSSGLVTTWGGGADIPTPGDYDGDGKTDVAVFRPSTGAWFILRSSTQTGSVATWGGGADVPVARDYDGDGKTDVAVFRPSTGVWFILQSSTQTGSVSTWGGGADVPVPADYDDDGKADVAVFRPSTGAWFILRSSTQTGSVATWGGGGDVPAPVDYDGDGKADVAVFRPSTGAWFIIQSSTGTGVTVTWGGGADIPVMKKP